jgi:hypothetical protein
MAQEAAEEGLVRGLTAAMRGLMEAVAAGIVVQGLPPVQVLLG